MKVNTILCFSVLTILLATCQPSKKVTIDNFHQYKTPPNGVKIADNFFCDKVEIDNISWLEYLFWNKKIFGVSSQEYISALPDTAVWLEVDSCLRLYVDLYLNHPVYHNYPVVGVTQAQALAYSKWRSDRVFEVLLVNHKIIKYDTAQTRENYFAIEKYFNGELTNVISEKKVQYYPEYRLPNIEERKRVLSYSDSIDMAYFENCKSKYCSECRQQFPEMQSNITPCLNDSVMVDPTRNIFLGCAAKKGYPIYNLRGNVSEWAAEEDIVFGGGWRNKKEKLVHTDFYYFSGANAWTGFRNVFAWKKWRE